jgi:hypothetical protein
MSLYSTYNVICYGLWDSGTHLSVMVPLVGYVVILNVGVDATLSFQLCLKTAVVFKIGSFLF